MVNGTAVAVAAHPMRVYGVQAHALDTVWNDAAPFLEEALELAFDKYSISDIYHYLQERDMQLWVVSNGIKLVAAAVTQILEYPGSKIAQLVLVGGEGVREWTDADQVLSQWAREQGCDALEATARPGWMRVIDDTSWHRPLVVLRKEL